MKCVGAVIVAELSALLRAALPPSAIEDVTPLELTVAKPAFNGSKHCSPDRPRLRARTTPPGYKAASMRFNTVSTSRLHPS